MFKLPIKASEFFFKTPKKLEEGQRIIKKVPPGYVLLSPLYTAICGSDLQYYLGEKSKEKLKKRLPLIPLHEGVCIDHTNSIKVIPIAGDFRNIPQLYRGAENTWPNLPYLGATMPGLARTYFIYPQKLTLKLHNWIPDDVASLVEPLSIALRAVRDIEFKKNDKLAIIGTGGLAFLTIIALLYFKISKKNIFIFGVDNTKLKIFRNLGYVMNYHTTDINYLKYSFDIVIEAVGGNHFAKTLTAAFNLVRPAGKIGILGISDQPAKLNVSNLVNRKIELKGLTRSTIKDYREALIVLKNMSFTNLIRNNLIYPEKFIIKSVKDLASAFEFAASKKAFGRILLKWNYFRK